VEIKECRLSRQKIHSSWLIAILSTSIIVGAYLALYYAEFARVEWLLVAACMIIVGFKRRSKAAVVLIICAGLLVGLWRAGIEIKAQNMFSSFIGSEMTLTGRVAEDPTYDADGDLQLKLKDIQVQSESVSGVLWVSTSEDAPIKRSDVIEVEGKLNDGFGTIPAAMYRARVTNIERQDYVDVGRDVRDSFANAVRSGIKEPEASLGTGYLLGQKSELPEKLENELRLLGLTHIVVASGYNLSILVRFARRLFARISRFSALAISGLLVYGFTQITGFSPSMSRAGLITSLSLLAWYFGRKFHPLVLLPFSAAITIIINPSYAWGDIGWLLSFAAFIGVIILSPLIHAYFWGDKKPGNLRQVFIETMSAQILTLPIIAYVFGQYSILSLPANVLILPLIPIAMLLTFIAGLGGLVVAPLAGLIGYPAELLISYMTTVISKLAILPQAESELLFSINTVVVFYIILFSAMIYLWRRTNYKFREYNIIE
jgi:competence protein ComEC